MSDLTTNINKVFYEINNSNEDYFNSRNGSYKNKSFLKKGALKVSDGIIKVTFLPIKNIFSSAYRVLELTNNIGNFFISTGETILTYGCNKTARNKTVKYAKLSAICTLKIAIKPFHIVAEIGARLLMLASYKHGNKALANLYNIDKQFDHTMGCISNSSPRAFNKFACGITLAAEVKRQLKLKALAKKSTI